MAPLGGAAASPNPVAMRRTIGASRGAVHGPSQPGLRIEPALVLPSANAASRRQWELQMRQTAGTNSPAPAPRPRRTSEKTGAHAAIWGLACVGADRPKFTIPLWPSLAWPSARKAPGPGAQAAARIDGSLDEVGGLEAASSSASADRWHCTQARPPGLSRRKCAWQQVVGSCPRTHGHLDGVG